jgi:hypothetical protein
MFYIREARIPTFQIRVWDVFVLRRNQPLPARLRCECFARRSQLSFTRWLCLIRSAWKRLVLIMQPLHFHYSAAMSAKQSPTFLTFAPTLGDADGFTVVRLGVCGVQTRELRRTGIWPCSAENGAPISFALFLNY